MEEPQLARVSLPELARRLGAPGAFELGVLQAHWEDLVGPQLGCHSAPRSLQAGVLVVVAESGVWAAELRFHSARALQKVQSLVPGVVSVVVKVGTKDEQSW